jgi:hypothetical protein
MTTEPWTSRPLKELIRTVALSVAEGQEELDRRAMRVQRELERATESGELDVAMDASWLRFSEVTADLQVAVSIEGEEIRDDEGTVRGYRPVIGATPVSPRTRSQFDIDAEMTSDVTLSIVPVPPERRGP